MEFYVLICSSESIQTRKLLLLWQPNRKHVFQLDNWQFVAFFATAFVCEGTTVGESCHSLYSWHTAKLSLIDGNCNLFNSQDYPWCSELKENIRLQEWFFMN
jgi:hypothetical protein